MPTTARAEVKGCTFAFVCQNEPGHVSWILEQPDPSETLSIDIWTLRVEVWTHHVEKTESEPARVVRSILAVVMLGFGQ